MAQEVRTEDSGEGYATTWYDDGTWVAWDITTGEWKSQGTWDTGQNNSNDNVDSRVTTNTVTDKGSRPDQTGSQPAGTPVGRSESVGSPPVGSTTNASSSKVATDAALAAATQAAQVKYMQDRTDLERDQFNGLSAMQKEQLAYDKAKEAFSEAYQNASLTGTYNGEDTWAKIAAQAGLTGYLNGAPTLAREQLNQQSALGLLQLDAGLTGPRNAFKYARTLAGTPGGLRDIVASAAGNYKMAGTGGGDVSQPLERMSLGGLVQDIQQGYPGSTSSVHPPGTSAPSNYYNYEPTGNGGYNVYPPGIQAPDNRGQISTQAPQSPHQATAMANNFGNTSIPLPNQWNAENVSKMGTYQKDLLTGLYEDQGYDPQAAWDTFQQSLPNYGGPKNGAVSSSLA